MISVSFLMGLLNCTNKESLAEHKGETSNQLFSVLEEWEKNLKGCFKESTASFLLLESPLEADSNM